MIDAEEKQKDETIEDEKPPVILEGWYWNVFNTLSGVVYNHYRIPDGTHIYTSVVIWIDEAMGIAKTLNTVYVLRNKCTDRANMPYG